jgi:hypothetical protein
MIFDANAHQAAHDRQDAARGRAITIKIGTGSGYTDYCSRAVFVSLTERDLIPGSDIRQGDIKLIISSTHWPAGVPIRLEPKDRIEFDGRQHSVVACDPYSRMIGEHRVATEVTVRG